MRLRIVLIAAVLAGTAAAPTARGAKEFSFKTAEGCGVTRYAKDWAKANIASMSWSGRCNDNKRAAGEGVLTVTLKSGGSNRYAGAMKGGTFQGQGDFTSADGTRRVGEFASGWFVSGKIFDADGKIKFDGSLHYASLDYANGKLYFADGGFVEGSFIKGAAGYDRRSGMGIDNGVVKDLAGNALAWWVRGARYTDYSAYLDAWNRAMAEDTARMQAENAAAAAAYEAERKRIAQEEAQAWAQLGAAVSAGAVTKGGQQAKLQAMTNALNAPAPGGATGFTGGMIAGATRGAGGGVGANFMELPRGPARFDPSSTASDESGCIRIVIERTGKMTNHSDGTSTPETWVLLKNDCNYDVWAMYCFTVTRAESTCANYSRGAWMGHGTVIAVSDRDKRVNALFGGFVTQLEDPFQMVHIGACRFEIRTPGNWQSGSKIRGQHRYTPGGGFEFRCDRTG